MRLRAFTIYVWWLVSAVTSSGQILPGGGLAQMGWLNETTIASGLKEALRVGIEHAVNVTGSPNGYFRNQVIKILRPEPLQVVEKGLRAVGYDPHVDEFVLSMNRVAKGAAPAAKPIFWDAITTMSIDDARRDPRGWPHTGDGVL